MNATLPPSETHFDSLLDACIHCGFCLPACPTYRATGSEAHSPRGRIYLMREAHEGRLPTEEIEPALDACLGCIGCQTACPSGVNYEALLRHTRHDLLTKPSFGLFTTLKKAILRWGLPSPIFLKGMRWGLWAVQRLHLDAFWLGLPFSEPFSQQLQRWGGPHLNQWLRLAPHKFKTAGPLQPSLPALDLTPGQHLKPNNPNGERVALFLGCVMNALFAEVHQATARVLLAQGYEVIIPLGQTCCGALAEHAGASDIARPLAEQNLRAFLKDAPDWVVLNSAGCGAGLKSLPDWLDHPQAKPFAHKVIDIMALLAQKPLRPMAPLLEPLSITYHAACHLHHAQHVQTEPLKVLAQIPNLTLIPLKDASMCCGSAGIYNLKNPELANTILAEKMIHVLQTNADGVVSGNPGCLMQLQMGLRQAGSSMKALHPIQLLSQAYLTTQSSSKL